MLTQTNKALRPTINLTYHVQMGPNLGLEAESIQASILLVSLCT